MDIRIGIEKNSDGTLTATTGHPKFYYRLFRFERSNVIGPQWKFWPSEHTVQPVTFDGDAFPVNYFKDLCRARFFTEMGVDEYPGEVTVVKGQKYVRALVNGKENAYI